MGTKASAVVVAAVGFLTLASSAWAAVTQSSLTVTSPTGLYVLDDQVLKPPPTDTMSVTGTTNGTSGDRVDINCYTGPPSSDSLVAPFASNVPVQADGSFSTNGEMSNIAEETCALRAVPHGDTTDYAPGTSWPYTGPTLALGKRRNTPVASGPNVGDLESYYLYASQLRGAFDYASLGGCPIDDSYVYDPVTFGIEYLDFCDAYFSPADANSNPTRSELQVDGADAYVPGNIRYLPPSASAIDLPGFPRLTYSDSVDPATGNLVLDETDQTVKCSPGGYPATVGNCTRLVPTGVQVRLHITQTQAGRVATVVQYFSSTDGHAHTLDLLEQNDFYHLNQDGELNFPWTGAGLQPYSVAGQALAGPAAAAPGSFYIKGSASVPDGGESALQGSVTFSNPPASFIIVAPPTGNNSSWLELHYTKHVPATGSVALGFTYSNAFLASEVAGYATASEAAFRPSLAITYVGPPTAATTVSGTATDATGIVSVSVNGHAAKVTNGSWSARVSLRPGANTITALATNVFGYTDQAQTPVDYSPPRLSALRQAHRRWREHGHRRRGNPVGTSFSFWLSERARVGFVFISHAKGRRHIRGVMSRRLRRGHDSVSFPGKLDGKWLAPGRYTVLITASVGGARSATQKLSFTIRG